MAARGRNPGPRLLAVGLGITFVTALAAPTASAQNYGPDPYQPYTNQYRSFASPRTIPSIIDARPINPSSSALGNPFDDPFGLGLPGVGLDPELMDRGVGPRGVPYYRTARRLPPSDRRQLDPADEADRAYYRARDQRFNLYWDAMNEKDSKKRTELLKKYEEATRQATLRVESTRRGSTTTKGAATKGAATKGATTKGATRTPSGTTAPATPRMRTPAPTTPAATRPPTGGTTGRSASPAPRTSNPPPRTVTRSPVERAPEPRRSPDPVAPVNPSGTAPAANPPAVPSAPVEETPSQVLERGLRTTPGANPPAPTPGSSPR